MMDKDGQSSQDGAVNVNLTPELERLVQEKVRSGLYNNQSEVVRAALRVFVEQERLREAQLERLRTSLTEGIQQADRGELLDGPATVRSVRRSLKRPRK
jgi:antitoxin ParD1/3/4